MPPSIPEDADNPPPGPVTHTGLANKFADILRFAIEKSMTTLHESLVTGHTVNGQSVAQTSAQYDHLTHHLHNMHSLAYWALRHNNAVDVAQMQYNPPFYHALGYEAIDYIGEPYAGNGLGGIRGTGIVQAEDAGEGPDSAEDGKGPGVAQILSEGKSRMSSWGTLQDNSGEFYVLFLNYAVVDQRDFMS
ncbi:hypothetical protein PENSPDRAFT_695521 [Peniophora sp. CONT]|nr:hypothetical protein PENSPDRAFT_695521 [Peniophora sp. CONT]